MTRTILLLAFAASASAASTASTAFADRAKPNVVIILADDLGWADVSYHGGYVRTPHIDRLTREGVELDRFYVSPMCSPTRAGLMTGRYPIRFGLARAVIPPWRNFGLDTTEVTIADVLGQHGYRHRGIFGKWHLGHQQRKWHPLNRGFTRFVGHYNGAIDYFTHVREGERDWQIDFEPSAQQGYATDLIADEAAKFIKERAGDGPFFCYVPFNAPHSPFQAPQKYLEQYKSISAGDTANDEKKQQRYRRTKQTLAAMITCMDDGVGRILQAIDDAGVRDNTVVWFFSDNGGVRAIKENNLPLRGDKLSVFEGGVRVPASVRWPAVLQAGSKVSAPIGNIDVLPTVMKMAGAESHGGKRLDGVNVLPWLKGQQQPLRRDLFFYHGQQGEQQELIAVSTPEWKLVVLGPNVAKSDFRSPQHRRFLFAINDDPLEKENLVDEHPDVVGQLAKRLAAFRKLQPQSAVPVYGRGKANFKAPKNWRIPDR